MKLEWKSNRRYSHDESKATSWTIKEPFHMSIHKYIGTGDALFFSCPELRVDRMDLYTEDFEEAEEKSIEILQERLKELTNKVNSILIKYTE